MLRDTLPVAEAQRLNALQQKQLLVRGPILAQHGKVERFLEHGNNQQVTGRREPHLDLIAVVALVTTYLDSHRKTFNAEVKVSAFGTPNAKSGTEVSMAVIAVTIPAFLFQTRRISLENFQGVTDRFLSASFCEKNELISLQLTQSHPR